MESIEEVYGIECMQLQQLLPFDCFYLKLDPTLQFLMAWLSVNQALSVAIEEHRSKMN